MHNDAALPQEITRALRPTLHTTERIVRNAVFPEIADETLRMEILANDRISGRLFDSMLQDFGIPTDDQLTEFDGQDTLSFVLKHDRANLVQHLGLAGECQRIAKQLLDHTLNATIFDLGPETLRIALTYRDLMEGDFPDEPLTLGQVQSTGENLLTHWVWSLPINITGRAAIALGVMAAECTPSSKKASLAEVVITDMMERSSNNGGAE